MAESNQQDVSGREILSGDSRPLFYSFILSSMSVSIGTFANLAYASTNIIVRVPLENIVDDDLNLTL
jgi:hypothetical protein